MSNTLQEFKDFINQGNVVQLAVGVIIGGAFGKIVSSLTDDVITPALLKPAMDAAKVNQLTDLAFAGIKYGSFLAATLNFLIVAFVLFMVVKALAKVMTVKKA